MQHHFTLEILDVMTCFGTRITPNQTKTALYFHEDINKKVIKAGNGMYCKVPNIPLEVVRAEISMMDSVSAQQFECISRGQEECENDVEYLKSEVQKFKQRDAHFSVAIANLSETLDKQNGRLEAKEKTF